LKNGGDGAEGVKDGEDFVEIATRLSRQHQRSADHGNVQRGELAKQSRQTVFTMNRKTNYPTCWN